MTTDNSWPISAQLSSLQLLLDWAAQKPELPAGYITVNRPYRGGPAMLDLQLNTPSEFEQWRAALGIAPARVSLHPRGRGSWVEASTVIDGIRVTVAAHGILLTEDQLSAPRGTEITEVPA
ncbi:hypothetical protein ACGFS9_02885 [Streptomyces sp. NPDC048566]|uniref:hypothetical protein n=1 Tax=Streptomyces sp. NPDC048566 TaxID=3365569 RepID=UPI0037163E79